MWCLEEDFSSLVLICVILKPPASGAVFLFFNSNEGVPYV